MMSKMMKRIKKTLPKNYIPFLPGIKFCEGSNEGIDTNQTTRKGIARCPKCGKRLKARPLFDGGGCFCGIVIPPHKAK